MGNSQRFVNIYVACFHSYPGLHLKGSSGQFEVVESAIQNNEWPYDNGDDPSFYAARHHGAPLTWGVCRPNVRTALKAGDMVAFISFSSTQRAQRIFQYRLCCIATVERKIDHRFVLDDSRLKGKPYLNALIKPNPYGSGWVHNENQRPKAAQHSRWLWLIAERRSLPKEAFDAVEKSGQFTDATLLGRRRLEMAGNYVIFGRKKTFIATHPLEIATAHSGSRETWTRPDIRRLLFCVPGCEAPRDYIRTRTKLGYAHPHIHWSLSPTSAQQWRLGLIQALTSD